MVRCLTSNDAKSEVQLGLYRLHPVLNDVSTDYRCSTSYGYKSQKGKLLHLYTDETHIRKGNQEYAEGRDAGNTNHGYKLKENGGGPGTKQEEPIAFASTVIQAQTLRSSDVEDSPVHDRFANVEGMHAVPPLMTRNYIPSGTVGEVEDAIKPKVWSDALIIEEYESDSDDEYVINPLKEQEKPSFAFVNTVKHVKTPRETVKEQNTCSLNCDFHEKRMAKQVELNKQKGKGTSQGKNRLVWNNVQRLNYQNKFVPKAVLTKTGRFPVNAARQNLSSQAAATSTARKVNTARPIVNEIRPRNNFYKSHSPIRRPFNRTTTPKENFTNHKVNTAGDKTVSAVGGNRETAVKASTGCNWRSKRHYWNKVSKYNSGSTLDDPQKALKNKGIVDSGCSKHMTRNKAYLVEYQDYNGGPVAFGGSKGQITGNEQSSLHKVAIKEVKEFDRPTRLVLTLKPLLKIDPKDKGKGVLEEEPEPAKKLKKNDLDAAQLAIDEEVARQVNAELQAKSEIERVAAEEATQAVLASEFDEI
ncbi:hypothetical protein Tco_0403498 [Tanacetum coccineum]